MTFRLFHSLCLYLCLLLTGSCSSEVEPDLLPYTQSGQNTMSFYVDGIPFKISGKSCWSCSMGVKGGLTSEKVLLLFGHGPTYSISIDIKIHPTNPLTSYELNGSDYYFNYIQIHEDGNLGGTTYVCNEHHKGKLQVKSFQGNLVAGIFYFDAVNPETGKVLKVTDGRFDISFQ